MRIKVVPNETPNADGTWLYVPGPPPATRNWFNTVDALRDHIPPGHHLVTVEAGEDRA